MTPFWLGWLLGFGIGLNVAGAVYWSLYKRVRRIIKTDIADVRANHARIEYELHAAIQLDRMRREFGDDAPPREWRQ